MQVILKKDIPELGRIGETVKVRDGYARNYLIPRSLAVAASTSNLRYLEHQKRLVGEQKKKAQKESEALVGQWSSTVVKLERRFNDSGKMFGTVSTSDITEELKKHKIEVDRRNIEIETVKAAGTYDVRVRLPGDVYLTIKLEVIAREEKAPKEKKARTTKSKKTAATSKASEESSSEETPA